VAQAIEPPFQLPQTSELLRIKSAVISTSKGKITFELYPEAAPWHVANFKYLADNGFLRGRAFHILIDDFIIQGGRNNNPELHYLIPAEFSEHKHEFGTLGMARAADYLNPQRSSSSTQFHVLLREASNMDGSYTIFGKLIDGADVLESLRRNDKIIDVIVYMENASAQRRTTQLQSSNHQSSVLVNEVNDVWATHY
jgi:cyclophilin family peptidyl-prolyl cis-trans isomerase